MIKSYSVWEARGTGYAKRKVKIHIHTAVSEEHNVSLDMHLDIKIILKQCKYYFNMSEGDTDRVWDNKVMKATEIS